MRLPAAAGAARPVLDWQSSGRYERWGIAAGCFFGNSCLLMPLAVLQGNLLVEHSLQLLHLQRPMRAWHSGFVMVCPVKGGLFLWEGWFTLSSGPICQTQSTLPVNVTALKQCRPCHVRDPASAAGSEPHACRGSALASRRATQQPSDTHCNDPPCVCVCVCAEAVPWDRVDAQVDLQEDLALVRVSAEALGVPLDNVDAAIGAAGGNWRAAMRVGLQAAPRRHLPAQGSVQLGRVSAAVCCSAAGRV